MKKIAHTIYLEQENSNKFSNIPKHYRSKFLNDLLGDFFKKNTSLEFRFSLVDIPDGEEKSNETVKMKKINDEDNEDAF